MPKPTETLGDRIHKARKAKRKYTLQDLATEAGTSKGYIWELENNSNANPSAKLLLRIAQALNVTVDWLLTGDTTRDEMEEVAIGALKKQIREKNKWLHDFQAQIARLKAERDLLIKALFDTCACPQVCRCSAIRIRIGPHDKVSSEDILKLVHAKAQAEGEGK
jgi:transcriptional regulator with XRE-family HTH domain